MAHDRLHSRRPSRTAEATGRSGFSLVELSLVIVIIGEVTASGMMMGSSMIESARRASTNNKLDAIEMGLKAWRVAYLRLPCPADASLATTNANYGVEAATPGTCTGGTPAANQSDDTNDVVAGAVPFKAQICPRSLCIMAGGERSNTPSSGA